MKKLFVLGFVMNLFVSGYSQASNKAAGGSCSCPSGWASCTASCWFSDCCICFNPATSEGGCGCWFGVGMCKSALIGADKSGNYVSADAKSSFSFERFNEMIKYLSLQKIDVSKLTRDLQTFESKYSGQAGKASVQNADLNNFIVVYTAFINGLTTDQKNIVRNYIDNKEKTN